jgi:hypothetical protein
VNGFFELVFVAGAVAIAFWSDVRFRAFRPARLNRVCIHIVISTLVCAVGMPFVADQIAGYLVSPLFVIAAIVGLYLPALVYGFLAGIWALAFVSDARRRFGS